MHDRHRKRFRDPRGVLEGGMGLVPVPSPAKRQCPRRHAHAPALVALPCIHAPLSHAAGATRGSAAIAGKRVAAPVAARRAAPRRARCMPVVEARKVAVLGAAGGIGQPLSLLLKMNKLVTELALYDIANVKGVAADLSHCNTPVQVG